MLRFVGYLWRLLRCGCFRPFFASDWLLSCTLFSCVCILFSFLNFVWLFLAYGVNALCPLASLRQRYIRTLRALNQLLGREVQKDILDFFVALLLTPDDCRHHKVQDKVHAGPGSIHCFNRILRPWGTGVVSFTLFLLNKSAFYSDTT